MTDKKSQSKANKNSNLGDLIKSSASIETNRNFNKSTYKFKQGFNMNKNIKSKTPKMIKKIDSVEKSEFEINFLDKNESSSKLQANFNPSRIRKNSNFQSVKEIQNVLSEIFYSEQKLPEIGESSYNNKNDVDRLTVPELNKLDFLDEFKETTQELKTTKQLKPEKNISLDKTKHLNKSSISNRNNSMLSRNSSTFNKFNILDTMYELEKQYSSTKISKDEEFMRRMMFDIFKRQTKEYRLENILETSKPKLDELQRVEAFNRLIEDANRRIDQSQKNEIINKSRYASEHTNKRIEDRSINWKDTYNRFLLFQKERDDLLQMKINEKEKSLKEKEDKIVEDVKNKTKKVSKSVIERSVDRLYSYAERIETKRIEKIKENERLNEKYLKDLCQLRLESKKSNLNQSYRNRNNSQEKKPVDLKKSFKNKINTNTNLASDLITQKNTFTIYNDTLKENNINNDLYQNFKTNDLQPFYDDKKRVSTNQYNSNYENRGLKASPDKDVKSNMKIKLSLNYNYKPINYVANQTSKAKQKSI